MRRGRVQQHRPVRTKELPVCHVATRSPWLFLLHTQTWEKPPKDIFSKGYGFGIVKLDLKTKAQSGVDVATSGSSNTETGKAVR
ncbi:hypothetical protein J4Q44_G00166440 [Coregonus suidteri]|uniref:Uncharacterized protein n=1 Tax=Coregonus suidteri TaxID=861788 RepID=A0AAN8R4X7_9TELE